MSIDLNLKQSEKLREMIASNQPFEFTVRETQDTILGTIRFKARYHRDEVGGECKKDILNDATPLSKSMKRAKQMADRINKVICPCANEAFNDLTGGFRTGNLWLIGGETGAGKTQLALGEAIHAAKLGKKVLYITTEMDDSDIYERIGERIGDEISDSIDVMPLSCLDSIEQWKLTISLACLSGGYDIIFVDYINSSTINSPETAGIPGDQKITVLLESLRKTIRGFEYSIPQGYDADASKKSYPCLVALTQLNRNSKRSIPDGAVVQGSFSASFKADLAANIVKANNLEIEAAKDVTGPKGFIGECSRMLYCYKNRNVNDINDRLYWMSYEPKAMSFSTIKYADGYDIDWKALGRE